MFATGGDDEIVVLWDIATKSTIRYSIYLFILSQIFLCDDRKEHYRNEKNVPRSAVFKLFVTADAFSCFVYLYGPTEFNLLMFFRVL